MNTLVLLCGITDNGHFICIKLGLESQPKYPLPHLPVICVLDPCPI